MTDFEIIDKYIKEYGLESDLDTLTIPEQTLYKCQLRETLSFGVYLLKYRFSEFCNNINVIK